CADDPARRASTVWRAPTEARATEPDPDPPEPDPEPDPDPEPEPEPDPDPEPEPDPDPDPEPEPEPEPEPLRVVVISDLNGSYGSTTYGAAVHRAVERIVALAPDLVLSTGDMVAGQRAGLDYEAMWAAFHVAVSDPLAAAGIPFAVTPGNHDASGYPGFLAERATFVAQWQARRPEVDMVAAADYPLRYAFRMGPALFVSLDATTVGPLPSTERAWLDDTLAEHPAPVVIVFGHMPLWPVAVGREDDFLGDAALDSLLERHGVDLYLAGHHHAYYPGRRGSLRQVTLGCLGSGPRALIGTSGASPRALLVLELDASGLRSVEAHEGTDFDERIERQTLPTSVGAEPWRVWRDDLTPP
ncbi:MAG: metallophosphoesterase, partial [Deltaproteobacteria bacterium]|nr:metallophosphoesterase [Deltaproteobacteria bacterium]